MSSASKKEVLNDHIARRRGIQPDDFRYTLIGTAGNEIVLEHAPAGWMEYLSEWTRDPDYHGYGHKILTDLRFYKEGADFLRIEYTDHGIEAKTRIIIEKLNRDTWQYEVDFNGDLDFSTCEDARFSLQANYFQASVIEGGMSKMLDARGKNEYGISLDASLAKEIRIQNPANAYQEVNWKIKYDVGFYHRLFILTVNGFYPVIIDESEYICTLSSSDISQGGLIANGGIAAGQNAWNAHYVLKYPQYYAYTMDYQQPFRQNMLSYRKDELTGNYRHFTFRLRITGTLIWNCEYNDQIYIRHIKVPANFKNPCDIEDTLSDINGDSIPPSYIPAPAIYTSPMLRNGDTAIIDIDTTIQFNEDYDFDWYLTFLPIMPNESDSKMGLVMRYTMNLEVTASWWSSGLLDPFTVRAIPAIDVFRELSKRVAEGEVANPQIDSRLLTEGALKDIYVTSGEGIRGVGRTDDNNTQYPPVVRTSLRDFFEGMQQITPVALFITPDGLQLERFEDAFDGQRMIADVGEARSLIVRPATGYMFNSMTVGTGDQTYENSNGRFEFATENKFSLTLTRVTTDENRISAYRTDSFGVTDIRLSYERKSTSTSSSDNDIFLIHATEKNGVLQPFDNHQIIGDNIQANRSGIFNVYLSPGRCLRRMGGLVRGILHNVPNLGAYLTSTSKTGANLTSKLLGEYAESEAVAELETYVVAGVDPVFWPQQYTIDAIIPHNMVELMSHNIGGYIQFSFGGIVYRGYPLKVTQRHRDNGEHEIFMLSAPFTPPPTP